MAKNKQRTSKRSEVNLVLIAILVVVIMLTVLFVGQRTQWFDQAAGLQSALPQQAITNLNSTTEMLATVNADHTMGPQTSSGNWSNSLPSFLKGQLVFAVTDPVQGGRPADLGSQGQRPTDSFHTQPTHTLPVQAQGNGQSGQGTAGASMHGPQTVTALNITISKVEVHIAYQGTPSEPSITPEQPGISPAQQGQPVDHWETLDLNVPTTLDLVQLAQTNDLSTLGLTNLAAGRYTEVRLYVSSATATLSDGTTVDLTIVGKDNIVRVVQPFVVSAGQTTTLTMAFDAQHSVVAVGGKYLLKPVVAKLLEQ